MRNDDKDETAQISHEELLDDGRAEGDEPEQLTTAMRELRGAGAEIAAAQGAFGPPPDVVLSGVNEGANIGRAVLQRVRPAGRTARPPCSEYELRNARRERPFRRALM
ncbi:MAG: hypothetical protein ACRDTG_13880 [Pseudonocardiaceae bacterium]